MKAITSAYRFGFNGQEKDNQIYGSGNSYTAEFWQYDSRLGRRWNLDPKQSSSSSLYACFSNSPIFLCDPMGDSTVYYGPNNNILHISVDGLPNAVVQLTEDDLQAFNNVFYWAKSNGKLHDDNANKVTRKFLGTTYLIDGFYDFWDKNSGHVLGGEGGPIVEHAAYLYKHGNTVSIGYNENYDQGNGTSVKWEEPFDIPFYQGDFNRVAKIHTHDAYGPTSGDPEPSIPDRRNHTDNQKGIFNIVVTKKEVYFYNSKSGINNFRVPRDIFEKREFYLKNPPVYNSKYNEK